MDFSHDPFPPSLPNHESPVQIVDPTMTEAMDQGGLDFLDSPGNFFSSANYADSPNNKSTATGPTPITIPAGPDFSPESSPQDSSGDSKRNSLESSDSSSMDVDVTNSQIAGATYLGGGPVDNQANGNDLFDFDSAASSPSPFLSEPKSLPSALPMNAIKMPYRSSPHPGLATGVFRPPFMSGSSGSVDGSPLSGMMTNEEKWRSTVGPNEIMDPPRQYISGSMLGEPSQLNWPSSGISSKGGIAAVSRLPNLHQSSSSMSYTSPTSAQSPGHPPTIHVNSLPAKSRVETQIPVKLTLYPLPDGVENLHLQTYTISKSKLTAKPPPPKSSDMLELHTTLVCTSAMKDPAKRERAMALAGTVGSDDLESIEPRLPSAELPWAEDDENRPTNGGPVHICRNCMIRETKRAARKKTKNVEEEELWRKDEKKRIIVFNTQEIQKWQRPSQPKVGNGKDRNTMAYGDDPTFPEGAMQVEIPMRIACYCRHQEEKMGFQVIFTIKDHEDTIVAQKMTASIIITDDHKTHAPPNTMSPQNPLFPEQIPFPGSGVFQQGPGLPFLPRNAVSATDLQAMHHRYHSQSSQDIPLTRPQQFSHTTSTSMTPRNLSRQVSPSAPSGPQNKKRKGSGSTRMLSDLTMTKLDPTRSENLPSAGFPSAGQSIAPSMGGAPAFSPNYAPPHGLSMPPMPPMPSQFGTNPPTPSAASSIFLSAAQRSQSMENLQGLQSFFSAPTSARPSRVPSPTASAQANRMPQSHAQILANSLSAVPGSSNNQRLPVIHKLTPGECSKSGGIEVTCLGSGFRQGLEVMFGDSRATTTTFWGASALVCLVPPAVQAGVVAVTFKHNYEQNLPSPPKQQAYFRYNDDDEQELIKHALALLNRQFALAPGKTSDVARQIIQIYGNNSSYMGGMSSGNELGNQGSTYHASSSGEMDVQSAVVRCLEMVDLDDRPYQASLNYQGPTGQSMLHLSASLGYYRLAAALLVRGADVDLRDNNGMAPIHFASLNGHVQVVRKLLSAGADLTQRSLSGLRPAHMATSPQVLDFFDSIDYEHRSRSSMATPISQWSRNSSVRSLRSSHSVSRIPQLNRHSTGPLVNDPSDDEGPLGRPLTPSHLRALSRRASFTDAVGAPNDVSKNSLTAEASVFASNVALSAWLDQALAQIQQLQQSLHRALPPIPNLPDYQANPVVRRISSLVPQRSPRPDTDDAAPSKLKEADYRWWELLTGTASSPPAYEDIYPDKSQQDRIEKEASALRAAGEALMDQTCEAVYDQPESSSVMETVNIGRGGLTKQQEERLRSAHARKVKKLRSDRKLFFIWIPLLVLIIFAMLRDRAPQIFTAAKHIYTYVGDRFQDRVVEVA